MKHLPVLYFSSLYCRSFLVALLKAAEYGAEGIDEALMHHFTQLLIFPKQV